MAGASVTSRCTGLCNALAAAVAAAIYGGGLACLARFRADREAGLQRLPLPPPVPTASIWLVVHRDNRQTPRIRAVLTHITERVRQIAPQLYPADAVQDDADLAATQFRASG